MRKIGIISMVPRIGATTIAYVLTDIIGNDIKKKCTLITAGESDSIKSYLDIDLVDDVTQSPNQLRLITKQGLSEGTLDDYCHMLTDYIQLLSTWNPSTQLKDSLNISKDSYDMFSNEFVLTDIHGFDGSHEFDELIKAQDYILIIVDQDVRYTSKLLAYMNSEICVIPEKKFSVCISKYSDAAGDPRKVARELRLKYGTNVATIPYEPLIIDYLNDSALKVLSQDIRNVEPRVYEYAMSIRRVCNMLLTNLGLQPLKEG